MSKLYFVDTVIMHKIRYCIKVDDLYEIKMITGSMNKGEDYEYKEFSQSFLNEKVISYQEITEEQYLKIFDEENEYLKDWNKKQKLELIN